MNESFKLALWMESADLLKIINNKNVFCFHEGAKKVKAGIKNIFCKLWHDLACFFFYGFRSLWLQHTRANFMIVLWCIFVILELDYPSFQSYSLYVKEQLGFSFSKHYLVEFQRRNSLSNKPCLNYSFKQQWAYNYTFCQKKRKASQLFSYLSCSNC